MVKSGLTKLYQDSTGIDDNLGWIIAKRILPKVTQESQ